MKVQQIPWTLKRLVPTSLRQITDQITRNQLSYQSEGDFQELRPYHSSDDRRQIAWKPSAKRNQLLVKTYQLGDWVTLLLKRPERVLTRKS